MAFFLINPQARKAIDDRVTGMLNQMGQAAVAEARRLVRVDTGQTRDSIGYVVRQSDKTLQVYADTPWALFLEMGTSRSRPHPFLRPALLSLRGFKLGSANFEIGFQTHTGEQPTGAQLRRAGRRVNRGVIKRTKIKVRTYTPHRPLS